MIGFVCVDFFRVVMLGMDLMYLCQFFEVTFGRPDHIYHR